MTPEARNALSKIILADYISFENGYKPLNDILTDEDIQDSLTVIIDGLGKKALNIISGKLAEMGVLIGIDKLEQFTYKGSFE